MSNDSNKLANYKYAGGPISVYMIDRCFFIGDTNKGT